MKASLPWLRHRIPRAENKTEPGVFMRMVEHTSLCESVALMLACELYFTESKYKEILKIRSIQMR